MINSVYFATYIENHSMYARCHILLLAATSFTPVARRQHPFGQLHFAAAGGADIFVFAIHRHAKMDVPAGGCFIGQRATGLGFGVHSISFASENFTTS